MMDIVAGTWKVFLGWSGKWVIRRCGRSGHVGGRGVIVAKARGAAPWRSARPGIYANWKIKRSRGQQHQANLSRQGHLPRSSERPGRRPNA